MLRDKKIIAHYQKVVQKYNKLQARRPLTSEERQQLYNAEAKIEEEYKKPLYENLSSDDILKQLITG